MGNVLCEGEGGEREGFFGSWGLVETCYSSIVSKQFFLCFFGVVTEQYLSDEYSLLSLSSILVKSFSLLSPFSFQI